MMASEHTHLLSTASSKDLAHEAHKKTVALEDLYPTPPSLRTWTARDFGAIWVRYEVK